MRTANTQGIAKAVLEVAAMGAILFAASTKAQAQFAAGVQVGQPYYNSGYYNNGYYEGRRGSDRDWDGYRDHERREAYARQQEYLREQEYLRQQEYARREAYARQRAWQRHEAHEREEEWEERGGRDYGWDR